jgi:hypothetical protein
MSMSMRAGTMKNVTATGLRRGPPALAARLAGLALACAAPVDDEAPAAPAGRQQPPGAPGREAAVRDGGEGPLAPGPRDARADQALPSPSTAPPMPAVPPPSWGDGPQPPQTGVLPVILLDSMGKSFGKTAVPGRLRVVEAHDGRSFDLGALLARPATLDANMTIRMRGNSSSRYAKKSFSIELQDGERKDTKAAPVLDMPPETDWILYACYADKTCLRNALAYTVGRQLGRWNPRFRFVEVLLNGEYLGLYNVVEKIKLDKRRVPLPSPAADASSGDVSGGYIVKRDGPGDGSMSAWVSRIGNAYTLHVPNERRITPAQRAYLIGYFDRWEAAMRAPDHRDPTAGYRKWIDVTSFVDFILTTELAKGVDSYRRSAYLYKEPDAAGGRLYAGPLWDFDLSFGNSFSSTYPPDPELAAFSQPDGLMYDVFRRAAPPHNMAFWWYQLLGDPAFQRELKCRWLELRRGPLATTTMNAALDGWVKLIAEAEKRDHARWPVLGRWIWGMFRVGATYEDEVAFLRTFLDGRARWLDANLPGTCS